MIEYSVQDIYIRMSPWVLDVYAIPSNMSSLYMMRWKHVFVKRFSVSKAFTSGSWKRVSYVSTLIIVPDVWTTSTPNSADYSAGLHNTTVLLVGRWGRMRGGSTSHLLIRELLAVLRTPSGRVIAMKHPYSICNEETCLQDSLIILKRKLENLEEMCYVLHA